MTTLTSKYNFRCENISNQIYTALAAIAISKGQPLGVYLQVNTKLTAIITNSTHPMMKNPAKTWVNLGDYSFQLANDDYDRLNQLALKEYGQSISAYLSATVTYW